MSMAKRGARTEVPKLRFPEFQGAQTWEPYALIGLADKRVKWSFSGGPFGSNLKASDYTSNGVRIIQLQNIGDGEFLNSYQIYTSTSKADELLSSNIFPGEILISKMGDPVGRACIVPESEERYVMCSDGIRLVVDERTFSRDFAFFSINFDGFRRRVEAAATGSTRKRIGLDTLKQLPLDAPQLAEQQKIADCLTSLDEVIAAQGQKVEALKVHKRGLMQQLFPREGETRPRLRFPEFRDAPEWTRGKASDIVDVLQGYGFPERLQGSREGEFPFYKVSDISACVDAGGILLDEANNHIDAYVLEELRAKLMPAGSTVFAKIGEAIRSNKRAITSRPCLVDNNAAGVKAIAGLAQDRFVYYLWCQVPLIEYAGGVVPAVNKSAMEQIPICFPKPEEQQRIADSLSSLDSQIEAQAKKLIALKTHKQGLMQQLFPISIGS